MIFPHQVTFAGALRGFSRYATRRRTKIRGPVSTVGESPGAQLPGCAISARRILFYFENTILSSQTSRAMHQVTSENVKFQTSECGTILENALYVSFGLWSSVQPFFCAVFLDQMHVVPLRQNPLTNSLFFHSLFAPPPPVSPRETTQMPIFRKHIDLENDKSTWRLITSLSQFMYN